MANVQSGNISSRNADLEQPFHFRSKLWVSHTNPTQRISWFIRDIAGIFFITLGLMTLLGIIYPRWIDGILVWWVNVLRLWFGAGIYWFILLLISIGVWLIKQHGWGWDGHIKWGRIIALEISAFASLVMLSSIQGLSIQIAESGFAGGRIGWGLSIILQKILDPVGFGSRFWIVVLSFTILMLCIMYSLGFFRRATSLLNVSSKALVFNKSVRENLDQSVNEATLNSNQESQNGGRSSTKKITLLPPQFRKKFRIEPDFAEDKTPPPGRDERLPDLDLLNNSRTLRPDERHINLTAGLIEKSLSEFGIPAKVVGFSIGPTVTQFAVEPGYVEKDKSGAEGDVDRMKVRVAQISSLKKDLALALSAERLRIEAPVPGRPYVGIEIPNTRMSLVRLRPILESEAFYKFGSPLTIALGRDVSGYPVVADLITMPHLLIAGTTGSGKSVCIASLATCLVMNNTPEDLRLVMIDPKMVELIRFNGLPHLLGKVETDLERILGVLRWVVVEMDRRYKLLEESRSRNLDTYNRKMRRRKGGESLPRIVVMIDELADLMMSAPDQTEHNLVRLAQLARATGIHLVLATQRPSTDVVTGLIKANFPARISFAVASSVDSRVILDTAGAESLLGNGDMLFLPPEASTPIRCQGVIISDQEVESVIDFWKNIIASEDEETPAPWNGMLEEENKFSERDQLIEEAIKIVSQSQRASASMLQRRLRIGYPRAARLMDELEEIGVVGSATGSGREREVLVGTEEN